MVHDDKPVGYVQLRNDFWRNTKVRKLWVVCPQAVGAYALMLSWCGDDLSDGRISDDTARYALGINDEILNALQDCRLVDHDGGVWTVHDFLAVNRSRAKVLAAAERKRQRDREYQARKYREKRGDVNPDTDSVSYDSRARLVRESYDIVRARPETQNPEPITQEKEEELHSSSKESENLTADDWAHTHAGTDAISRIRDQYPKLDMRDALQAFTTHHGQTMKSPGMWTRLYQGWCKTRANMSGTQPARRHLHTWKCEHVLQALGRDETTAQPDSTACELAKQLNQKEKQ